MVNFIQQTAFKGTLGQCLLQDTGFAGTFYKIPDFKIVFIFKVFLCHFFRRSSKVAKALSGFYLTTFCQELKVALTGCFWCPAGPFLAGRLEKPMFLSQEISSYKPKSYPQNTLAF